MNISLTELRKNYTQGGLLESNINPNPLKQFQIWFQQALAAEILEPNAMTLATVNSAGKPTARIVLLKYVDENGFSFFTNYESEKGRNLSQNPWASLVFWWGDLERQVRIEGKVEKVSSRESDDYFSSRPVGSQLGAWVSEQSTIIHSREVLDNRLEELKKQYLDQNIPRPEHWGGFRLIPHQIEFWQGRENRLHDRLRYRLQANKSWIIERLAP